jgi:membrane protein implicated in regulation of membrane protease activity
MALHRRRQVFRALAAAVPGAFALALLFGGVAWWLPVLAVAALLTYSALLVRLRRRTAERRQVVRLLAERRADATAASAAHDAVRRAGQA